MCIKIQQSISWTSAATYQTEKVLLATSDPSYILKRSTASLKARRWQFKHWSEWGQPKKMNNYLETNGTQFSAFSVFVRDFIETKVYLASNRTNKTRRGWSRLEFLSKPSSLVSKQKSLKAFLVTNCSKKSKYFFRDTDCRPSPLTAFAKSL